MLCFQGYNVFYSPANDHKVSTKQLHTTDTQLVISDLRPNTTYDVSVQAFNSMGDGPRSGSIHVTTIPTLHFTTRPDDVEVTPGTDVNLTCVAHGSLMVQWRLGALVVTHSVEGESVLILTDVRQSNTYTCVAESNRSSIEHDAQVKVKGQ